MKKIILFASLVILIFAVISCDFLAMEDRDNIFDPDANNYDPDSLIPPGLIDDLTITASHDGIDVSWTPPDDSDFAGILIVKSLSAITWEPTAGTEYAVGDVVETGVTVVFYGTEGSFGDTDLVSEAVFYYSIFTYDDLHNYSEGIPGQVTVPDIEAPGEAAFSVSPSFDEVNLTWIGPDDSDLEGYILVKSDSDITWTPTPWADYSGATTPVTGVSIIYHGSDTSYTDTDVTAQATYYYKLFTYDGDKNYSSGTGKTTTLPYADTPDPITVFSAVHNSGEVDLSWSIDGLMNVAGVLIVRSESTISWEPVDGTTYTQGSTYGGVLAVFNGDALTHTDADVEEGKTYFYKVFSYNGNDDFAVGLEDDVYVPDITPPDVPGIFSVDPGIDEIDLSWNTTGYNDFSGVLLVRSDSDITWAPVDGTSYDPDTLSGDVLYIYKGTNVTYTDTNVEGENTYYYNIFSFDEVLNYSGPAEAAAYVSSSAKEIIEYDFTATANMALSESVTGVITGTVIDLTVPYGTDVTGLKATFVATGILVVVDGTEQVSGETANDFTSSVIYGVEAENGTHQDYTVTVTLAAPVAGHEETYTADGVSFSMAYVSGGLTFPTGTDDVDGDAMVDDAYWIGETEVTYELWYEVHDWALSNGYTFANPGREGHDGTITDPEGAVPTTAAQEPVTTVNWRDSMVWCNALTEWYNAQESTSFECVYTYESAVIRDSQDSNSTACDNAVVDSEADGFRLLTSDEYELAARYIDDANSNGTLESGEYYPGNHASGDETSYCYPDDAETSTVFGDYAWYSGNSGGSIHTVGTAGVGGDTALSGNANALGLYDMSGNVYEWCFTESGSGRVFCGGSWSFSADSLRVGDWDVYNPYFENDYIGFRFCRTAD